MIEPQCAIVTVFDRMTAEPVFDLMLYGLEMKDLCVVPAAPPRGQSMEDWIVDGLEGRRELLGAEYVKAALRKRNIDPDAFTCSIFFVRDVRRERAYVRRHR